MLHTYLQAHWDARGQTRSSWCRSAGLSDATVARWGNGCAPELRLMRQVADELGTSLLEVLQASGYLTPDEAAGRSVSKPAPPSLLAAIGLDPTLTEEHRAAHLHLYEAWREVESRLAQSVTIRGNGRGVTRQAQPVASAGRPARSKK